MLMLTSRLDQNILSFQIRMNNIMTVHQIQSLGDFYNEILELTNVTLDLINEGFIEHLNYAKYILDSCVNH